MFGSCLPRMVLPHQIFFYPTDKFMSILAQEYNDCAILEAGAGVGHVVKTVKGFGEKNNIPSMKNMRGFDVCRRDEYEVSEFEIFYDDALECGLYHKNLQVLVCRPNHSGWVEALLEEFLMGYKTCKRFIYCGLESNLPQDFSEDQLSKVTHKYTEVGQEGEVMLVWEF